MSDLRDLHFIPKPPKKFLATKYGLLDPDNPVDRELLKLLADEYRRDQENRQNEIVTSE